MKNELLPSHSDDLLTIGFSVKNLTYGPIIGGAGHHEDTPELKEQIKAMFEDED